MTTHANFTYDKSPTRYTSLALALATAGSVVACVKRISTFSAENYHVFFIPVFCSFVSRTPRRVCWSPKSTFLLLNCNLFNIIIKIVLNGFLGGVAIG